MKILGVIPSRYASTRFPGKPLADILGKSMIQRVYEQAIKSISLLKVIVATDDNRIYDHVKGFGGCVTMTDTDHPNGTSRCNEVVSRLKSEGENYDVVINIQGDEPMINPKQIDKVAALFTNKDVQISTLVKRINNSDELHNPNVVKAVMAANNKALYFSRNAIPFNRDEKAENWLNNSNYFKHLGIYGYLTNVLPEITALSPGKLESIENLEQLRWLENGYNIYVDITEYESIAIDTPEDLSKLVTNP